ncbi:MAG: 1-deoxy-D-xylulose-5-phosphate reductoisomerase [Thermoanaerobaculia bacterium]
MIRVALLGATGSIGRSTLEVVRQHPERLAVTTMAALGSRLDELEQMVRELEPQLVAVHRPEAAGELARRLGGGVEVVSGVEGCEAAATHPGVDRVVAAMVGAAGLRPVHAAIARGTDVALANKESMVVAGPLLARLARKTGARILPIDSEHAALHQALRSGGAPEVRRLMLTASGGPFRERPLASWSEIEPEDALAHPTWQMGPKISVDSATLMNKGLEVIEARHLFDVSPDAIEVVVHPQSLVHSLVEYVDGSWIAQLSRNEMVYSIQYALAYPERWGNEFPRLEPTRLGSLTFEPVDRERFPAVDLARSALVAGESAPAVLNAANEEAVSAFLARRATFRSIVETVATVLDRHRPAAVASLEEALSWDDWGRRAARELLGIG